MTPARNEVAESIRKHLHRWDFPAGKEELLLRAESNQAPDHVMAIILGMPDREFRNMDDLVRGVDEAD